TRSATETDGTVPVDVVAVGWSVWDGPVVESCWEVAELDAPPGCWCAVAEPADVTAVGPPIAASCLWAMVVLGVQASSVPIATDRTPAVSPIVVRRRRL